MRFALLESSNDRLRLLVVAACAICLLIFAACSNQPTQTVQSNTPAGNAPPRTSMPMPPVARSHDTPSAPAGAQDVQFGWTLLDNRHMKLSDYQGKVVVLDFYATWCEPCRMSTPHMVDLQRRYGSKGLQVIGLNVGGTNDRYQIPQFVQQYKIQYALGFPDDEMTDALMYDDDSIPQTFVFDQKGRLVQRFVGYDDNMPHEMEQLIQKAVTRDSF